MLKMSRAVLCACVVLCCASTNVALAITADGDLSDWGVALDLTATGNVFESSSGNTYTATQFVGASFIPSVAGVDFLVDNDSAHPGGEFCDVEAMYVTRDGDALAVAVVTTSDPNGQARTDYGTARFGPGDLAIVVDGVTFGVGARPVDLKTAYGSILPGSPDVRDPASWDSFTGDGSWSAGDYLDTFTTTAARVEQTADWHHVDYPAATYEAYFRAGSGTLRGTVSAAWKLWTDPDMVSQGVDYGDYYVDDIYGVTEPYHTWIYEVRIPVAYLDIQTDSVVLVAFMADCANDRIIVEPGGGGEIPEPAALGLIGIALVALKTRRR